MILTIDSTHPDQVKLKISLKNKEIEHVFDAGRDFSEKLLPEIHKFLKKHKKTLNDLTEIVALPGLNGFSRGRTTVATVNALCFALKIPVNGSKQGIKAEYSAEPTITLKKK